MATKGNDPCFDNAEPGEELFTLLARDKTAPVVVFVWVVLRVLYRKNAWNDPKLIEARSCVRRMREWRRLNR